MQIIKDVTQGDILIFKADDGNYKALLCTSNYRNRSPHNFTFAALTYDSEEKPMVKDILESHFFGAGNTKSKYSEYSEKELERMWAFHPEVKPYYLSSYRLEVWRKDFMKFRDNIEFLGNIKIVDYIDRHGNSGVNASSWDFLRDFFNQKFKIVLRQRGQKPFNVAAILQPESN